MKLSTLLLLTETELGGWVEREDVPADVAKEMMARLIALKNFRENNVGE